MKKILYLIILILLTGCVKDKSISISELAKKIDSIETDELNIELIFSNLERNLSYKELNDISDINNYVNLDNLEEFAFKESKKDNLVIIMILKIKENKEIIKQEVDNYFNNLYKENNENNALIQNRIEYEYNDYLIYIVGEKKTEILDTILANKETLFLNTVDLTEDEIKNKFDLELNNDYVFKISSSLEEINDYIIIKGKDLDEYKSKIDTYYNKIIDNYTEKEKDIILNRLTIIKEDYLFVIASHNNTLVSGIIEKSF